MHTPLQNIIATNSNGCKNEFRCKSHSKTNRHSGETDECQAKILGSANGIAVTEVLADLRAGTLGAPRLLFSQQQNGERLFL
mmetsp:Transcript_29762/g.48060  ORF Transcript_29762/g.48060 Transcript_29762/m.48060 type:complete len:82 (-) Transcript_29762:526-771(-)